MISRYANPLRFMRLSGRLLPWLAGLTAFLFAAGLIQALILSPADYQQSETVRIMYVHVPAAWLAMMAYALLAGASFVFFIWRHSLADVAAKTIAPIGAVFTALALITGMLWGQPMWGTYWEWDARITSVLVLLFIYLGLIALRLAIEDEARGARLSALLAMFGAINLPVIKFSVDWWNTLHQPASVLRLDGPTIHPSMLAPLITMALAYMALFALVLLLRMRTEILLKRSAAAERRAASRASLEEVPQNG